MRRSRVWVGFGLTAVAASAFLVAYLVWDRAAERSSHAPTEAISEIEAETRFSPSVALFGDTVRLLVDVVLDKTRVDPESVRIAAELAPFEVVGNPRRIRRDAGDSAYLRTTFALRCLTGTCVPSGQSATYQFAPARISFTAPDEQARDEQVLRRSSITAQLPAIRVFSRFVAVSSTTDPGAAPWRADLLSLPSASYRVAPGVLLALLLSVAALAALAGVALAYLARPRRVPAPPPEPEPEPPPVRVLTPLEQALILLERSIRVDGAADQRRALELVAEELELEQWGDRELARTARALAWSEEVPPIEDTSRLAARVRAALPHEYEYTGNGDGGVA